MLVWRIIFIKMYICKNLLYKTQWKVLCGMNHYISNLNLFACMCSPDLTASLDMLSGKIQAIHDIEELTGLVRPCIKTENVCWWCSCVVPVNIPWVRLCLEMGDKCFCPCMGLLYFKFFVSVKQKVAMSSFQMKSHCSALKFYCSIYKRCIVPDESNEWRLTKV